MAIYASKMMRVAAIAAATALALSACGKGDEKQPANRRKAVSNSKNNLRLKSAWLLYIRKPLH